MKVFESEQAIADSAAELDMVVNVGKALGEWNYAPTTIARWSRCAPRRGE